MMMLRRRAPPPLSAAAADAAEGGDQERTQPTGLLSGDETRLPLGNATVNEREDDMTMALDRDSSQWIKVAI